MLESCKDQTQRQTFCTKLSTVNN